MRKIKISVIVILYFLAVLCSCAVAWALHTWVGLTMDELVFHLMSPLEGTGSGLIQQFLLLCLAPALAVAAGIGIWLVQRDRKFHQKGAAGEAKQRFLPAWCRGILLAVPVFLLAGSLGVFAWRVDLVGYIQGQSETSAFVQEQYVDPKDIALIYPEKKQNLIYIYLESMEITYADEADGGAFLTDYIPELTALAQSGQCFADSSGQLNGGIPLPGATWTMGAMMAQTSGLPLQLYVKHNAMSTQDHFFTGMTGLGDLLKEAGYHQVLMLGSKATFGGRDTYFTQHGEYDILDYKYAVKEGWIPEDYYEFWGFEDEKLISYAKEELLQLAEDYQQDGTPFNLTMLTVDTHFEDGYVCRLCDDAYEEQYANVLSCSSRQVAAFVEWIRQQDFYEDTAVVIAGDHLTMDSDFCGSVAAEYQRKTYTVILNGVPDRTLEGESRTETDQGGRLYSTFDLFPTTLAALGVTIPGDRLGLGVNLYSDTPTLLETYGLEMVTQELQKKSLFIEALADIDLEAVEDAGLTEDVIWMRLTLADYDVAAATGSILLSNIHGVTENTIGFQLWVPKDGSQGDYEVYELSFDEALGGYVATVDLSQVDWQEDHLRCFAVGGSGKLWETMDMTEVLYVQVAMASQETGDLRELPDFSIDADDIRCLPPERKKQIKALGYE
jgi:phosphoglycerol transferase